MDEGVIVRGIPQVQRNLAEFPRLLVMRCFGKALSRAAGVFEQELAARCPEAKDYAPSDDEYGPLLENLMSVVTIDTNGQGGRAQIGFGKKSMVALWIEYGHRIVTHAGRDTGKVAVANPFMRRAFAAAAERAVTVFVETVQEFLESDEIFAIAA